MLCKKSQKKRKTCLLFDRFKLIWIFGYAESVMCDVIKIRLKRKRRGEVGMETPIKEMDNWRIFMTSNMTLSAYPESFYFATYGCCHHCYFSTLLWIHSTNIINKGWNILLSKEYEVLSLLVITQGVVI